MSTHISFPDIDQFRNLIRNVASRAQYIGDDNNGDPVYDATKPLPTLTFEGTVKLHGTNAAICVNRNESRVWYQSRERVLTIDSDNAGFTRHFEPIVHKFLQLIDGFLGNEICVYGEWCGSGIQKGVGISTLPKMFVVFAVKVDSHWWGRDFVSHIKDPSIFVYNIYDYPTWTIDINFADAISSQNKLGELTVEVETQCPVAKAFGKEGIGEGIVWKCITPGWGDSKFWMKVKGEKHSVSKVKTLAAVDMELVNSQKEFVLKTVTDARCQQSITKLREANKPLDRTSLGEFIRWIYHDIVKEETDTATASNLDLDKMGGPIAQAAKTWFFANEATFPV